MMKKLQISILSRERARERKMKKNEKECVTAVLVMIV
jgi:hypothetical protein